MLYYGDEIAMTDVPVPPPLRRDKMTARQRDSRDVARTPMQWDASPSAGFTADGVTPWLPFGDNASRNVAAQREDPASTLRLCRDLIALRRTAFAGQVAAYERLPAPPGVWAYRSGPLLITANFTDHPVPLPDAPGEVLLTTGPDAALGPWQGQVTRAGPARTWLFGRIRVGHGKPRGGGRVDVDCRFWKRAADGCPRSSSNSTMQR